MTKTRELAFVDSGLSDIAVLLQNLRPGVEAIVLEADRSAPAQMAAALEARPNLAAVHVLAHGRSGEVSFAGGALSRATLPEHAADLARIGRALDGAGLHLWSCHTARGDAGRGFTEALAGAAGVPVAASTQPVGAAALGGRWTLDSRVGDAEVRLPLTVAGVEAYPAVMATKTWTNGGTGVWTDPAAWDPAGVLGAGDDVIVDKPGDTLVVNTDTFTLASILIASSVLLDGYALDASGGAGITVQGTLAGVGAVLGDVHIDGGTISASTGNLSIGGMLLNDGMVLVDTTVSGNAVTLSGGVLDNTGGLLSITGDATNQATVSLATMAGLGTDGAIEGDVVLSGKARLVFDNGMIDTIADSASLRLDGADASVAAADVAGNNSALTSLAGNAGTFELANGASVTTTGALENTDILSVDSAAGEGGSTLTIGGAITNLGTIAVGNDTLSASTTLEAASIDNNGGLLSIIGGFANQAKVSLSTAAGLGADGTIYGNVTLSYNAVLEFASGSITTIDTDASLRLEGLLASVAIAGASELNSALTSLATIDGIFELANSAVVTIDGAVEVNGVISVSSDCGEGGSTLAVDGAVTNYGAVLVGNCTLSGPAMFSADSLDNDGGLLSIIGSDTGQATVSLASQAGLCIEEGLLDGYVELAGNALLEFAGGTIDTIEGGASLSLDGLNARIAVAGDDTWNSALVGLTDNYGILSLANGAEVITNAGIDFNNEWLVSVDGFPEEGGSTLSIGGTVLNAGGISVGNDCLSGPTTLHAAAFDNSFGILLITGSDTSQAAVTLESAAGLCTDEGVLDGFVQLSGKALLEFASGSITIIEDGASLWLDGAEAFVAAADSLEPDTNSALVDLFFNGGDFELSNGAVVETSGGLKNEGHIHVDINASDGGSTLSIGGTLDNCGTVEVGSDFMSGPATLTADAIYNAGGVLSVIGDGANRATVSVASDAGLGAVDGLLDGYVELIGNALLEFAGGQIVTIGVDGSLVLDGAMANIAIAGSSETNSALVGLASNEGALDLANAAVVTIAVDLANSGWLTVDGSPGEWGGSSLTIDGTLTNAGLTTIGNGLTDYSSWMSVEALVNLGTGTIFGVGLVDLYGTETTEARLDAGSVDNGGIITVHQGGVLNIVGNLGMNGESTLTVEEGGTLTTGALTTVRKTGDATISTFDLQGQAFESKYKIVVQSGTLQFTDSTGVAPPELTGAGIIQGEISLDGSNTLTITPTGLDDGSGSLVYHYYHTDLELAHTDVLAPDGSLTIVGSDRGEILRGGAFNDAIFGGTGADKLYGLAGMDLLEGGGGNDRLDGGTGADEMKGGDGNDKYFVDNVGDKVFEFPDEGTDTVYTKVSFTLGVDEEVEGLRANAGATGLALGGNRFDNRLVGRSGDDILDGAGGDDRLNGNDGTDTLDGGDGNDRLDGGLGADDMTGGDGNDSFYVDNPGDEVHEELHGGTDRVYASADFTLTAGAEIEILNANAGGLGLMLGGNGFNNTIYGDTGGDTLSGGGADDRLYGDDGADTLYGDDGDDRLYGDDGADRLDGGVGADKMTGGAGNDLFYVDDAGDEVFEAFGGGTDAVYASVGYTLAAGEDIESLRASVDTGLILGGNDIANTVFGAGGDDWLNGGGDEDKLYGRDGDDTLDGGTANDRLYGGAGEDIFLFDNEFMGVTNIDTVADFELGTDVIHLGSTYFGALGLGQLSNAAFAIDHPSGTGPQIVYNSANGYLSFDSDGVGPDAAGTFAKVTGAPALTAASFFVVA